MLAYKRSCGFSTSFCSEIKGPSTRFGALSFPRKVKRRTCKWKTFFIDVFGLCTISCIRSSLTVRLSSLLVLTSARSCSASDAYFILAHFFTFLHFQDVTQPGHWYCILNNSLTRCDAVQLCKYGSNRILRVSASVKLGVRSFYGLTRSLSQLFFRTIQLVMVLLLRSPDSSVEVVLDVDLSSHELGVGIQFLKEEFILEWNLHLKDWTYDISVMSSGVSLGASPWFGPYLTRQ